MSGLFWGLELAGISTSVSLSLASWYASVLVTATEVSESNETALECSLLKAEKLNRKVEIAITRSLICVFITVMFMTQILP